MIVVIGEAIIDLIESKESKGQFQAIVGGANNNVALALARRGNKHEFLARISSDRFGSIIKEKLQENNVDTNLAIHTNEPATLAIISVNDKGQPQYTFYTEGTADWGWTKEELPTNQQLKELNVKAIQFGCLTMAMEPGNKVIEEWARNTKDITISHDINIRAALNPNHLKERERVERLNSFSNIIKASDEDLAFLYPNQDPKEGIRTWGIEEKLVLLTKGSEGTTFFFKNQVIDVPARKVEVVDTVGAGDTFIAHLLGQLDDNNYLGNNLNTLDISTLTQYVTTASIAASITCMRVGCEPPSLEELAS